MYKYFEYKILLRSVQLLREYRVRIQYNTRSPLECLVFITNIETDKELVVFVKALPTVIKLKLEKIIEEWENHNAEQYRNRERRIRRYENMVIRTEI